MQKYNTKGITQKYNTKIPHAEIQHKNITQKIQHRKYTTRKNTTHVYKEKLNYLHQNLQ